jgi:cytochrome c peroxidase
MTMRVLCSPSVFLAGVSLVALALGCEDKKPTPTPQGAGSAAVTAAPSASAAAKVVTVDKALLNAYDKLPAKFESAGNPITDEKVALGKMLYFETRLSKSQTISCNSCHDVDKFGVDGEPTSKGHKDQRGGRNSPTVYNAAGHIAQFWDGRAKDVEEQAVGPILNPIEMAMKDDKAVIAVLASMPEYPAAFKKAFPTDKDPLTYPNVGKAIGAFERTLVTPSRWDKYIGGDDSALTDTEKAGFLAFTNTGCNTCHAGSLFGGREYKKLGLAKPWPTEVKDQGRFEATKDAADKGHFKVPSLRNIEKTAPYMHDGSIKSLDEMVKLMARHQLTKELSDDEVKSIVAFLKTLTGEPAKITKPELPKSGPKTPKPDAT